MYKKTLLSLAIASTLTLTGCLENDKEENENVASDPNGLTQEEITELEAAAGTYPIWNPAISALPIPNDLIFDKTAADGTFAVPDSTPPVTTAINSLSGASTTAPIDIQMSGLIEASSLDADTYLPAAGPAASAVAVAAPTPNPNQNVFLLELEYASGSPVQGLSAQELPKLVAATGNDYTVTEKVLDGNSYIRIIPKKALKPNTRYIVAITNGVTDASADNAPIQASPSYKHITGSDPLLSDSLIPIRGLTNGLWEKVAVGYFDAATNLVRADFELPALTADNIALSYSFTTSGDEKVLNYIADPAQWFNDQITTFVGVNAAKSVVGFQLDLNADGDYTDNGETDFKPGGAQHNALLFGDISADGTTAGSDGVVDYSDIAYAVNASISQFPTAGIEAALPTLFSAGAPCEGATGTGAIGCISASLVAAPVALGGFADLLPTPQSVETTFGDEILDINQVSSLTASLGIPAGLVSVVQGSMTIPYYSGIPSGANGTPLLTDSWVADDTLASAINTAFAPLGLSIPQADPMVSTAVNYIFPFPKKASDDGVTIPVLGIYPTNNAGDMKTAIFQHGITTDRSAALAFGGSLVAGAKGVGNDVAVIAIDQPLHGIDGISPDEQATLATQLLSVAGTINPLDGLDATEQGTIAAVVAGQFSAGIVAQIATPCPGIELATNGIEASIQSVIAGVCDGLGFDAALGAEPSVAVGGALVLERTIANGASTIAGLSRIDGVDERHFGFSSAGAGVPPKQMDYAGISAANSSGSMFINLTSFLTSRDNLRQQVVDLLTLRKSIGEMDLDGGGNDLNTDDVYFFGHSLGTINGIPFVAVANDSATSTDDIVAANMLTPGGGITRLLENSPNFAPSILGGLAGLGLTQDTSSFQTYMNVLQATLDSADPSNFVQDFAGTTPVLFTEVVGDTTIPNSVDEASEILGDGSISFLSGTEPLAVESDASSLTGSGALTQNIVRFTEGNHGTPAFPSTGTAEETAAFAEMVGQGVSIVVSGGTAVSVGNAAVIEGGAP